MRHTINSVLVAAFLWALPSAQGQVGWEDIRIQSESEDVRFTPADRTSGSSVRFYVARYGKEVAEVSEFFLGESLEKISHRVTTYVRNSRAGIDSFSGAQQISTTNFETSKALGFHISRLRANKVGWGGEGPEVIHATSIGESADYVVLADLLIKFQSGSSVGSDVLESGLFRYSLVDGFWELFDGWHYEGRLSGDSWFELVDTEELDFYQTDRGRLLGVDRGTGVVVFEELNL